MFQEMSLRTQAVRDPMATTTKVGHQDFELLAVKAQQWKENNNSNELNNDTKAQNMKYKIKIQEIRQHVKREVAQSDRDLVKRDSSPSWRQRGISTKDEIDIEDQDFRYLTKITKTQKTERQFKQKNKNVAEMNRISYDRQFKRFLAYKDRSNSRDKGSNSVSTIKKKAKKLREQGFIVSEDLLDNQGEEDFQYENAEDMENDYNQIFNGRRAPSRAVLQHLKKYEYEMRKREYSRISERTGGGQIPKQEVLNHLFDNWHIMMLYSIDPFSLGDELDQFETETPKVMSFQQFSCFLLEIRPAIFLQYTREKIQEARKMGRGIKCQPMQCQWIDETGIKEMLFKIFTSGDIFGRGQVQANFIISKLKKQAKQKNIMDEDVIFIVNIKKPIPLSRIIYELEYEVYGNGSGKDSERKTTRRDYWTLQQFEEYLFNHKRLQTPDKYKLIKEEVLAGRYDTSFVFLVAPRVITFIKRIFENSQKFAQHFVSKRKFLTKVEKDPEWRLLRDQQVRKQPYKDLAIQSVEETFIRMYFQGPEYMDIDEILEFLTNRGRPMSVQHFLYVQNQLIAEAQRTQEISVENVENSTDDEIDMDFANHLQEKRRKRMHAKMESKANSKIDKRYYNITIPVPFQMDQRTANKKESIRERKLKEMLAEKEMKLQQELIPIKPKQVPWYVKENMYERNLVEEERKRTQRLQQFKGELEKKMVPINQRLLQTRQIVEGVVPEKEYKFVATPLPWYCEVELLERINKGKAERRERILEEIIVKHTSMDLPEGVKRMIQRHEEIAEKRKAKLEKMSRSLDVFDFKPPRVKPVPDFPRIHANLQADFEEARKEFVPTKPVDIFAHLHNRNPRRTRSVERTESFSPMRSKPYRAPVFNEEDKPKTTAKHEALVQYRKRQRQEKLRQEEEKQEEEQIRIMKKEKLAPYVRRALRQSNVVTEGQKVHEEASRLERFQMEERQKKAEYEAKMMEIYAKVLHRPFLFKNSGQYGQNDVNRVSRLNYQKQQEKPVERREKRPEQRQAPERRQQIPKNIPPKPQPAHQIQHEQQENDEDDDLHIAEYERMRKFQENHPGHYSDSSDPADHVNSF